MFEIECFFKNCSKGRSPATGASNWLVCSANNYYKLNIGNIEHERSIYGTLSVTRVLQMFKALHSESLTVFTSIAYNVSQSSANSPKHISSR